MNMIYYKNGDGTYTVTTSDNICGVHFIDNNKVLRFETKYEVKKYFMFYKQFGDVRHLVEGVMY